MSKFPTKEADILALAKQMKAGYTAHSGDFPSNTGAHFLGFAITVYKNTRSAQIQAKAALKLATEEKQDKLNLLKDQMKTRLRKSEVDVSGDPDKLAYLGWGPKAAPIPVEAPAPPVNLRTTAEGQGTARLAWDSPDGNSGGPVRNYIIERRQQPADGEFGPWTIAGSALTNEINLTGQPCRLKLEYRVGAINTGGESIPSNTVAVVL